MKTTKTAPQWAIELVEQVCKDYRRKLPRKLQWFNTKRQHTSGYTRYDGSKIHISAGKDEWEHKPVLLHELTHQVIAKTRKGQSENHSMRFWRLLFEFGERYKCVELIRQRDIALATEWRPGTRKKAQIAYDQLPKTKSPS